MRQVKLLIPIRHDGTDYKAEATLPPISDVQAKRLVALKAAVYVDGKAASVTDEGNTNDDPAPNGTEGIASMTNKEMVIVLKEAGVKLTGRENKAELQALLTEAWKNKVAE